MKISSFFCCLALAATCTLRAQVTYTMADTVLAKRYMEEAKGLMDSARYDAALEKLAPARFIFYFKTSVLYAKRFILVC